MVRAEHFEFGDPMPWGFLDPTTKAIFAGHTATRSRPRSFDYVLGHLYGISTEEFLVGAEAAYRRVASLWARSLEERGPLVKHADIIHPNLAELLDEVCTYALLPASLGRSQI